MATGTNRRPTNGKGGQARTRLARAAVIQAARALFLEGGYAATTIEAISDLSDVPPATVYRLFSSKLGILKEVLHASIAGDDQACRWRISPTSVRCSPTQTPKTSYGASPASSSASCRGRSPFTGSSSAQRPPILTLPCCSRS